MKNGIMRRNGWFGNDLFDAAMNDFFPTFYGKSNIQAMRTDIKEHEDSYELNIEIPGMEKQDIGIELKDGYLNISVQKTENEEADKDNSYIHRERVFSGSRSYYVGDISKEDIHAKYENGLLTVTVPKDVPAREEEHRIEIE